MTAIWLLSTRGRPAEAQQTINACQAAGMTSQGVVYCDETPYPKLKLPRNWRYHHERTWGSLQASMQWCLNEYPDASSYGWLADDTRPRTQGWDRELEAAAGQWNLAYARDLWLSEDPFRLAQLEGGMDMSSGICWGGDLVRCVGWWALPGVRQAGIDTAWMDLVRPLGLHRYVGSVTVEHLNWRTGKREKDAGDDWTREGDEYVDRDLVAKNRWAWSQEYRNVLLRLMAATGTEDGLLALRESYTNERQIAKALPAARLIAIAEGRYDTHILNPHTD